MSTGSELIPTAFLTHVGVLGAGLLALRHKGWPRHAWWQGTAGMALVMLAARAFTPPEFNVSLAFRVWQGGEDVFPVYRIYLVVLLATNAATFFTLEQLFLRFWPGPAPRSISAVAPSEPHFEARTETRT